MKNFVWVIIVGVVAVALLVERAGRKRWETRYFKLEELLIEAKVGLEEMYKDYSLPTNDSAKSLSVDYWDGWLTKFKEKYIMRFKY